MPIQAHRYVINMVLPHPHSPISTTGTPQRNLAKIANIFNRESPVKQYLPSSSCLASSSVLGTSVRADNTSWNLDDNLFKFSPTLILFSCKCANNPGCILFLIFSGSKLKKLTTWFSLENSKHSWLLSFHFTVLSHNSSMVCSSDLFSSSSSFVAVVSMAICLLAFGFFTLVAAWL